MENTNIRTLVRGIYDIQNVRIQLGNRIVGSFKSKLGLKPGEAESKLEADDQKLLTKIRTSYSKMMDGVVNLPSNKTFKSYEMIDTYTEFILLNQYFELEANEERMFGQLAKVLKDYPIYNNFLLGVKGCGPAMAGIIVSEIDIHKAKYASSLWAYAGLDVASDGRGRGKYKEHLIERGYIDANGTEQTKLGITFKPWLKTKLLGVLAGSFLRSKSPYSESYYNYKNRLKTDPKHADKSDGHIHAMALRYMIKRFLVDLYSNWRKIEGLEVHAEYHEKKHGHVHNSPSNV